MLLVVHPQDLPERTQFAIDQYVLKGGKALVLVDPYSEAQATLPNAAGKSTASDLPRLFNAWGFKLVPDSVAGDRRDARRVAVPVEGRGSQTLDYVAWLNLQSDNLSRDDPITADRSHIAMATSGILQPIEGAATKFDPLIQTSAEAEQIPVDKVKGLPDVGELLAHFRPDGRRHVLAAHITGKAATAFPDGPPKDAGAGRDAYRNRRSRSASSSSPTPICSVLASGRSRATSSAARVIVPLASNAPICWSTRSRCWPAGRPRRSEVVALWRGHSKWSSASSAPPTIATPSSNARSRKRSNRPRPNCTN